MCGVLFVACCWLFDVRGLRVVCRVFHCWLLFVVRCSLCVVCGDVLWCVVRRVCFNAVSC